MIFHNHHIIPRHAGGTDDSTNLCRVNVKLHALLHKWRFEETGDEFDLLAYRLLSGGVITKGEVGSEVLRIWKDNNPEEYSEITSRNGKKVVEWNKKDNWESARRGGHTLNRMLREDREFSERVKQARAEGVRNSELQKEAAKKTITEWNKSQKGTDRARENARKGALAHGSKKFICLVTGKIYTAGGLTTFQKNRGIETSKRKEWMGNDVLQCKSYHGGSC